MASYMTTRLIAKQTANRDPAVPSRIATAVVSAIHSAECDDGIPPEPKRILKSHFLSTTKFKNILIDCAITHASSHDTNVGFAASDARKGLMPSPTLPSGDKPRSAIPMPPLR